MNRKIIFMQGLGLLYAKCPCRRLSLKYLLRILSFRSSACNPISLFLGIIGPVPLILWWRAVNAVLEHFIPLRYKLYVNQHILHKKAKAINKQKIYWGLRHLTISVFFLRFMQLLFCWFLKANFYFLS